MGPGPEAKIRLLNLMVRRFRGLGFRGLRGLRV